jgi:hypothetical protein
MDQRASFALDCENCVTFTTRVAERRLNPILFNEGHINVGESLRDLQIAEILLRSPSQRDGATCFVERSCV